MDIDIEKPNEKKFNFVIIGDIFKSSDNKFWLKIHEVKIDEKSINTIDGGIINCIDVMKGRLGYFNSNDIVTVVECSLKIIET